METVLRVVHVVAGALDALGVPYLVGGSLASSLHGFPRSTHDADLVANLEEKHVQPLTDALRPYFYVDEAMIQEAIRRRGSFNVIHLDTMFKVDIFVPRRDAIAEAEMQRRQEIQQAGGTLFVASPEDTVLQKLSWYKMGGGISERQWNDVLGVLKAQGDRLEAPYLREMARQMDVLELLERAWQEVRDVS